MTVYAIPTAPGILDHLTPGKRYPVLSGEDRHQFELHDEAKGAEHPQCFSVRDDKGRVLYCNWNSCAHLDGASWVRQ